MAITSPQLHRVAVYHSGRAEAAFWFSEGMVGKMETFAEENHTPWKDHDLSNLHDYVPAVNLEGCNGFGISVSHVHHANIHKDLTSLKLAKHLNQTLGLEDAFFGEDRPMFKT